MRLLIVDENIVLNRECVPGLAVDFSTRCYLVSFLKFGDNVCRDVVVSARDREAWKKVYRLKLAEDVLYGIDEKSLISDRERVVLRLAGEKPETFGWRICGDRAVVCLLKPFPRGTIDRARDGQTVLSLKFGNRTLRVGRPYAVDWDGADRIVMIGEVTEIFLYVFYCTL